MSTALHQEPPPTAGSAVGIEAVAARDTVDWNDLIRQAREAILRLQGQIDAWELCKTNEVIGTVPRKHIAPPSP
jgi:hypothetical protein